MTPASPRQSLRARRSGICASRRRRISATSCRNFGAAAAPRAAGHRPALFQRLSLVRRAAQDQQGADSLPLLGLGQSEHGHGHEPRRGRFHRQALRRRRPDRQDAGAAAPRLRFRRVRAGSGASRRAAEHRRRHAALRRKDAHPLAQRIPHSALPAGEQRDARSAASA